MIQFTPADLLVQSSSSRPMPDEYLRHRLRATATAPIPICPL